MYMYIRIASYAYITKKTHLCRHAFTPIKYIYLYRHEYTLLKHTLLLPKHTAKTHIYIGMHTCQQNIHLNTDTRTYQNHIHICMGTLTHRLLTKHTYACQQQAQVFTYARIYRPTKERMYTHLCRYA